MGKNWNKSFCICMHIVVVAQLRTVKLLNLHGFCHVFTIVIRLYCAERVVYGILLHMMLGKSAFVVC